MSVISSDLLRGNVDAIVLACLFDGKKYGNEIRRLIEKKTDGLYKPNEQSLYSAYHRLEELDYVKGSWGNETSGVTRKYYEITDAGREFYAAAVMAWRNAKTLIDLLIAK